MNSNDRRFGWAQTVVWINLPSRSQAGIIAKDREWFGLLCRQEKHIACSLRPVSAVSPTLKRYYSKQQNMFVGWRGLLLIELFAALQMCECNCYRPVMVWVVWHDLVTNIPWLCRQEKHFACSLRPVSAVSPTLKRYYSKQQNMFVGWHGLLLIELFAALQMCESNCYRPVMVWVVWHDLVTHIPWLCRQEKHFACSLRPVSAVSPTLKRYYSKQQNMFVGWHGLLLIELFAALQMCECNCYRPEMVWVVWHDFVTNIPWLCRQEKHFACSLRLVSAVSPTLKRYYSKQQNMFVGWHGLLLIELFAALQMCECNCYRPVMVWVVWHDLVTNIPWLCRQKKHFACSLRPVSAVSPTLKRYYSKQQDMFVGWHGLLLIELFAALQMCECNCYRPAMVWVVWHDFVTNIPWLCRQEKHFACSLRPVSAVSPTLKRYYSKQQNMFVGWHGLLLIELFAALQMFESNCYRPVMVWVVWHDLVTNIQWLCRQEKHFACSLRPVSAVSPTLKRYYSKQQDMFVGLAWSSADWTFCSIADLYIKLLTCGCQR